MASASEVIYEFGSFRLLAQERVLLHDGQPLLLTPKSVEMLLVLIENHGHVVPKDTLMERIWPDTCVQEDNITYNVSMLRKALSCGAEGEQYIETVPRRGYRFIAPVKILDANAGVMIPDLAPAVPPNPGAFDADEPPRPGAALEQIEGSPKLGEAPPVGRLSRRMRASLTIAVSLAVACSALAFLIHARKTQGLTPQDSVVLADFTNSTGEPVFDDTLRQALSVSLQQSPFLNLLSEEKVSDTLKLMAQSPETKLTPKVARELCQRAGSKAYIAGSIATLGNQFVLGLNAVNCQTGGSLVEEQERATGKEQVLTAMDRAAAKLRAKLGESLSSVHKLDTPVEQATTPSLEALQAFSLGQTMNVKADDAAAVPLFQRAIGLDPNFAMAYAMLGSSYSNLGETSLAAENTRKAYELRERVGEPEKFYILSHYYDIATGDKEKARQTYELWAQTYPRDYVPRYNLGVIYSNLGQYEKTLAENREGLRLNPTSAQGYANYVAAYLTLNRLEEASATAEEAQAKNLDSPFLRPVLYQLAFLQDDVAGMTRQVAWAAGKPEVEDVLLAAEADTAAYYGRVEKSRDFSRQAAASAQQAEAKETAAVYEAEAALREALFGNSTQARERATAALALSTNLDVLYGAALALACAGDAASAQRIAEDLKKLSPENTLVHFNYLPTITAQLALSRNDSSKAIETLQAASPYELGDVGSYFNLYPVYVRGEAYLAAGRGREAAVEFQKILDHRGVVWNEPIGALAHLGLARAWALEGDTEKARGAYQDFFTLWKDADPGIPILLQARAANAKLRQHNQ